MAIEKGNSFYNFRLRRHQVEGSILNEPLTIWGHYGEGRPGEGLAAHVSDEVTDNTVDYTDVLIILSTDDYAKADKTWVQRAEQVLTFSFANYCETNQVKTPFTDRPLGVHILCDGSSALKNSSFKLKKNEFITGLVPNLYSHPLPSSTMDLSIHAAIPACWEGFREVGQFYDDQALFTLGNHWLDNFQHDGLRHSAIYQLYRGPNGEFRHMVNPDLHGQFIISACFQNDTNIVILADLSGEPIAYFVLSVCGSNAGSLQAATTLDEMQSETIIPEGPAQRLFGLKECGALLQKIHFKRFMDGYDVYLSRTGELSTLADEVAATFEVRRTSVALAAEMPGVSVDGTSLEPGERVQLIEEHVIHIPGHTIEYSNLKTREIAGWPYVGEIRRPAASIYIPWGHSYQIGRSHECRVILPDETNNTNIKWLESVASGAMIQSKSGDIPKAKFYTDSIMVGSQHGQIDLTKNAPVLTCVNRNCYTFVRRQGEIHSLHPTKSDKGRHAIDVQIGDQLLIGNCLFEISFEKPGQTAPPIPAPSLTIEGRGSDPVDPPDARDEQFDAPPAPPAPVIEFEEPPPSAAEFEEAPPPPAAEFEEAPPPPPAEFEEASPPPAAEFEEAPPPPPAEFEEAPPPPPAEFEEASPPPAAEFEEASPPPAAEFEEAPQPPPFALPPELSDPADAGAPTDIGAVTIPAAAGLGEEGSPPSPLGFESAGYDSIIGESIDHMRAEARKIIAAQDRDSEGPLQPPEPDADPTDLPSSPGLEAAAGPPSEPQISEPVSGEGFADEHAFEDEPASTFPALSDHVEPADFEAAAQAAPESAPEEAPATPAPPSPEPAAPQAPASEAPAAAPAEDAVDPDEGWGKVVAIQDESAKFELGRSIHIVQVGWMVNGTAVIGNHTNCDIVIPESQLVDDQELWPMDYLALRVRGRRGNVAVLEAEEIYINGEPPAEEHYENIEELEIDLIRRDERGDEDFNVRLRIIEDRGLPDPRARLLIVDTEDPLTAALFTHGLPTRTERAITYGDISLTYFYNGETVEVKNYLDTYKTSTGFHSFFLQQGGGRFKTAPEDGVAFHLNTGDKFMIGNAIFQIRTG
jgi:hypothetical protein